MTPLLALALLSPAFQYPLDFAPHVSAAFGTYRIGHHHAGLDLYTNDDDTIPVRAAAAGRVVRVRRNHVGYGRAVYVSHPDGRQTVYAHLSAFGPALAPAIAEATADLKGYKFDARLKRGLPVKAGTVLGWVGTSGTDLVHLHFEVRDKGPVNPLFNGLALHDPTPPVVRRLMVVPRAPDAHVADTHDETPFEFVEGALRDPIVTGGDVVIYAQVTDAIDGARDDLIAADITLEIDGATWHHVVYDRVAYGDKNQTELDYHPRLRATAVGVFNRLRAAVAPVRVQRKAGRSLAGLAPGDHPARIIAKDAAGNEAVARFTLRVRPPTAPPDIALGTVPPGDTVLATPGTLRDTVFVQPLPSDVTRVDVRRDGRRVERFLTRHLGQPAVAFAVSKTESQRTKVGYVRGDAPSQWIDVDTVALAEGVESTVGPFTLKPDKRAFFRPYPTHFQSLPAPPIDGAEVLSPLYRLANGWMPTKGGTTLTVPWPAGAAPGGVGVYVIEGNKRWRVGTRRVGDRIVGRTVHLGDFLVLRDTEPPQIDAPIVRAHPAGLQLIVPIEDALSGLREVTLKVDGVAVMYEHQRAQKRLVWQPLPPGPHRIEVAARDREGHAIIKSFDLNPAAVSPGPTSGPPGGRSK